MDTNYGLVVLKTMVKVQCKMKTDLIIDHGDYHVGWVGFGLVLCFGVCFLLGGAGGGFFFFACF